MTSQDASIELSRLINGFRVSQAISVAASLGLADLVADGPRGAEELAAATKTDAPSLYRLMRALAAAGVFHETDDGRFSLTKIGAGLRSDARPSLRPWAILIGRPYIWDAWSQLTDSIRSGENAFDLRHGTDIWGYREAHPEENDIFNRAMMGNAGFTTDRVVAALEVDHGECVVDVGGSHGALLMAVLAKHEHARGILFDLPHVVARADVEIKKRGLAERCKIVGGDFFAGIPPGGDVYLMKLVVHDWDDGRATEILRSCRRALKKGGRLVLIERLIGRPNEDVDDKFHDLHMMVGPGGQERTEAQFATLCASADLSLVRTIPTGSPLFLIETVTAES